MFGGRRRRGAVAAAAEDREVVAEGLPPSNPEQLQPGIGALTRRGVLVSSASRLASQVLFFASSVWLARILTPQDYGVAALAGSLVAFALLLTDLGIGAAVVQRARLDEAFLGTVFVVNAVTGVVLTGLFVAVSGPVARLFGEPELAPVLVVGSLTFSLSLSVVHRALLERRLQFGRLGRIEVEAAVVGIAVTTVAALAGLGALSLVLGPVVRTAVTTALQWRASPWRPVARPTREGTRELWRFSRGLVGFQVTRYWARNTDTLLLGATAPLADLGLYNRAFTLMLVPVQQVGSVFNRALLPAYSALRGSPARFSAAVVRAVEGSAAVAFPLAVGMAAAADAFVVTAFGDRWSAMAPLVVLLALSAPPQIVGASLNAVYAALARNDLRFTIGLVQSALTVGAIVAGLPWGVTGVATALLAKAYTVDLALVPLACRLLRLPQGPVLRRLLAVATAAALMGGGVWLAGVALGGAPPPVVLAAQVSAGVLLYAGLLRLLAPSAYRELQRPVGSLLRKVAGRAA